jgi:hypothetical protein
MYVGIKSTHSIYDDFRKMIGSAMMLSRACFSCFECTFPSALQRNNHNWLRRNYIYILIYMECIDDYFHNFRMPISRATVEIAILIENDRSLKLCQTRQDSATSASPAASTKPPANKGHPAHQVNSGRGRSVQRAEGRG